MLFPCQLAYFNIWHAHANFFTLYFLAQLRTLKPLYYNAILSETRAIICIYYAYGVFLSGVTMQYTEMSHRHRGTNVAGWALGRVTTCHIGRLKGSLFAILGASKGHYLPYWAPQNACSWALTPNAEHLPLALFMSVDASCAVWESQSSHSSELTLQTVTYLCFAGLQKSCEAWEQPSKLGSSKMVFHLAPHKNDTFVPQGL